MFKKVKKKIKKAGKGLVTVASLGLYGGSSGGSVDLDNLAGNLLPNKFSLELEDRRDQRAQDLMIFSKTLEAQSNDRKDQRAQDLMIFSKTLEAQSNDRLLERENKLQIAKISAATKKEEIKANLALGREQAHIKKLELLGYQNANRAQLAGTIVSSLSNAFVATRVK